MQRTAPSDTLRAAVTLDARPVHRIARTANVPPTVLSRFMRRERGMTIQSLDRVAAAVGLELRPRGTA
jgi:hypothetical protein